MANRPSPEINIDEALVHSLLSEQFPELANLTLRPLSRGWDNTNFRLGADHIVRVPHRQVAAQLVAHEQRCLPAIADRVDMAISAPTHLGQASADYPWQWSITPWFQGEEAAQAHVRDPAATAKQLGHFFAQLHTPADRDAPPNPYRGCPLRDRADSFYSRLDSLPGDRDFDTIAAAFDRASELPPSTEHLWLHGDLHTRNMIVDQGALSAIIDWGDVCAGDPATDLAGAFMLVPDHIAVVQAHAGASELDWQRARGWAVNFAVIYLAHSSDDPVMGAIGARLLASLGL